MSAMAGKGVLSAGRIYCDLNFSGIGRLFAQVDIFLPNQIEMARLGSRGIGEHVTPLTVGRHGGASELPDLRYLLQV